jgi:hypothetical protein
MAQAWRIIRRQFLQLEDSTGTIRRADGLIEQQAETIRGQLREALRTAKVIEMMANDAKEPPTDKWFGSPSRWVN